MMRDWMHFIAFPLFGVLAGAVMYLYLPGWVGVALGALFLTIAVVLTVLALVRRVPGLSRVWKEFLDFLYGV